MATEEFIETYTRMFGKWYDQSQDILLTAKAKKDVLMRDPEEFVNNLVEWVVKKAYPKAKSSADLKKCKR